MNPTTTLSALEALALSKFDEKPFIEERPAPGLYPVDFLLRVTGNLTVAPGFNQLFVTTADVTRVLAGVLLSAPTIDLADVVRDVYRREEDTAALGTKLRAMIGTVKKKTPCNGPVRGDLSFVRRA